jgi:hypothetical protein
VVLVTERDRDAVVIAALFTRLFDDAAMYPPADLTLADAVRGYARHRASWYADTVGPFVCNVHRASDLAAQAAQSGLEAVKVAAVVPAGVMAAAEAVLAAAHPQLRAVAVETPLKTARAGDAQRSLGPLLADGVTCYVEIPVTEVSDRQVHELAGAGLRLKLRTGGTSSDAFPTEEELARALVLCAAERLAFKCTAGLHHAVRHRDPQTGFEHHGFLNVALAARAAASTGSAAATSAILAEHGPAEIAAQIHELSGPDVAAIRAVFCSFGTCSVDEPIADLTALGLVQTA